MSDIVSIDGDSSHGHVIVGWFTPDYRVRAQKFADNAAHFGEPVHLYARKKIGKWDTRQKPSVVLQAMADHPGKMIVLMDVDCILTGGLRDLACGVPGDADVTLTIYCVGADRKRRRHVTVSASSRVIIFSPTPGAQVFAQEWQKRCARAPEGGDESLMIWTYLKLNDLKYAHLDPRFAGREVEDLDVMPTMGVWHQSAHDAVRKAGLRGIMKRIERALFRTGRSRRSKDIAAVDIRS